MPDVSPEIIYTGAAKPPKWQDRAGQWAKAEAHKHTPEAHKQEAMRFFDDATGHLYGRSREIADALRPKVEVLATFGGWSKTMMELCLAGTAVGVSAVLVGKGVKSTAEVFLDMARRHRSADVPRSPRKTAPPKVERAKSWVDDYRKTHNPYAEGEAVPGKPRPKAAQPPSPSTSYNPFTGEPIPVIQT